MYSDQNEEEKQISKATLSIFLKNAMPMKIIPITPILKTVPAIMYLLKYQFVYSA